MILWQIKILFLFRLFEKTFPLESRLDLACSKNFEQNTLPILNRFWDSDLDANNDDRNNIYQINNDNAYKQKEFAESIKNQAVIEKNVVMNDIIDNMETQKWLLLCNTHKCNTKIEFNVIQYTNARIYCDKITNINS